MRVKTWLWQILLDFDRLCLILTFPVWFWLGLVLAIKSGGEKMTQQSWGYASIYLSIDLSIYLFYPILFCSAIFYSIYLFYSILFHSILSIYLSTSLSHVILSVGPCFRSVQNQILGWKHITGRTMYGIQFGTTDFSSSIYVSMCLSIYLSSYLAI